MEKLSLLYDFVKMFFMNICTFAIFNKIIKHENNLSGWKIMSVIITSTVLAITYMILVRYINPMVFSPILYLIYSIILSYVTKEKVGYEMVLTGISCAITYIIYIISTVLSGMILYNLKIDIDNPISLIVIPSIETIILIAIFKTKRFKNGFNFLKNIEKLDKIGMISIIIFEVVLVTYGIIHMNISKKVNLILLIETIFVAIFLIYWIQSQITKHYKKDMKSHTIEVQKEEIEEHLKTIEEVKTENLKLATAVHKYNHRISALEKALRDTAKNANNTEFAEEISVFLKETEDISKGFAKESEVITKSLPLTNITGIDNMFKFMQEEAINSGINFDLKINTSIHNLIDKIISKDKFETLLGDHLKDAIIAINSSDKTYKSILVILGIVDDCYELSIYDTGIEFEIDTLLKLGKERITTHKNTGGSGIGFMTTFETLKSTKASLIIEEYNPETTSYTKSVNIRFDGKNNYKIYSFRAEDIKNKNKDKKIIIKNIE